MGCPSLCTPRQHVEPAFRELLDAKTVLDEAAMRRATSAVQETLLALVKEGRLRRDPLRPDEWVFGDSLQ
jgi:hypothetical protein